MANKVNPWIGLESYKEGEILYGRDEDIRSLLECILNDRETLLYGRSGIGKSSILNAGILPVVRNQGFLPVVIRLSHKGKPDYLQQIKEAIANAMLPPELDESGFPVELSEDEQARRNEALSRLMPEVVPCKDPEKESFYEFFHRHTFHSDDGKRIKLLIIFDQFEELFSLQEKDSNKKEFFADLADLLNDIMPEYLQHGVLSEHETVPSSAVSGEMNIDDLLADFKIDLAEDRVQYVNDNQVHVVFTIREDYLSEFEFYSALIPSLKRNRFALRPINEEQAAQIIMSPIPGLVSKDVAKLIIKKVTNDKVDFNLDGVPEIEVDSAVLSLYLSRLFDSMKGDAITAELVEQKGGEIISEFYIDALEGISEHTIDYLEYMLLNGKGKRDNITVDDAKEDGKVSDEELNLLCNKRKVLRLFNHAGALRIEFIHDILCDVVKKHKEDREHQRLQEEELKQLLQEEERKRLEFEQKAEEEMARLEAEAVRIKMRNRKRLTWIAGILGATVACLIVWWFLWQRPYSEYYGNFTTKYGWPIGVGDQLRTYDQESFSNFYKLTRKGYLGQRGRELFEVVHIVNALGSPTENNFFTFPFVNIMEDLNSEDQRAREFVALLRKVQHLEYSDEGEGADNGFVRRMEAMSADDRALFSVQYYNGPAVSDSTRLQWAVFLDAEGRPLRVRDNGVDRVLLQVKDGFITGQLFYSETGSPLSNYDSGIYGYSYEVDTQTGFIKNSAGVNQFGEPVGDPVQYDYDRFGRCIKANDVKYEYSKDEFIAQRGDMRDTVRFSEEGRRAYLSSTGLMTELPDCDYIRFWIDEFGNASKIESYDSERMVRSSEVVKSASGKVIYNWDCDRGLPYEKQVWSYDENQTVSALFGGYSKDSINIPIRSGDYHKKVKIESEEDGLRVVTISYYEEAEGNASLIERNVYEGDRLMSSIKYDSTWTMMTSKQLYYDSYGVISSESVVGIDGSPIRCGSLEEYGMLYYKMRFVRNFLQKNVVIQGENEFGEECLITLTDQNQPYVTRINVLDNTINDIQDPDAEYSMLGVMMLYRHTIDSLQNPISVCYIHNLTKDGSVYKAGVKDGDLLVAIDGWRYSVGDNPLPMVKWNNINDGRSHDVTVLRPFPEKDGYEELSFSVKGRLCGAEIYKVYFTEKEVERLKKYIR